MRTLEWLSVLCLSGAACVTALANQRHDSVDSVVPSRGVAVVASGVVVERPSSATSTASRRGGRPRVTTVSHLSAPALVPEFAVAGGVPALPSSGVAPAGWTPIPRGILEEYRARRARERGVPVAVGAEETFDNTYYEFPEQELGEAGEVALRSARCGTIARVSRAFHDRLCVQGSGRLASGKTVSFAVRDCDCAEVCPRTGQTICYDVLDPGRFPNGRGAMGRPIVPLSTVAVDPAVIPLGSHVYVRELAGLPRADGTRHDGCFVAEDRGIGVRGRSIDVFTGEPSVRRAWEAEVPSHRGVHVVVGDSRCAAGSRRRGR